ncbi:MAG: ferrochelatase [bacterium]
MEKTGYLIINLGTPASPSIADVRAYLKEFLMDPYVLDVPGPIRSVIVNGFILPFRPKKSAHAYASIWDPAGSPLLLHSEALLAQLKGKLDGPVALGMRYGKPDIPGAVQQLVQQNVTHIVVAPLYPQYADSTVTTSLAATAQCVPSHISTRAVTAFFEHPAYIGALARNVAAALPQQWDHLLLSYHGLPERHMKKADPTGSHCMKTPDCCNVASPAHATCYRHQVYGTSHALAEALGISCEQYSVSFQSRLGGGWLQPYTDRVLQELPGNGVEHLVVACPAFVADNLETLEEMGLQGRETFLQAGGKSFDLVPCLNEEPAWIDALAFILMETPETAQTSAAASETSA